MAANSSRSLPFAITQVNDTAAFPALTSPNRLSALTDTGSTAVSYISWRVGHPDPKRRLCTRELQTSFKVICLRCLL